MTSQPKSQSLEMQAPICPYCFDDHSSTKDCDVKDLKKRILIQQFEKYERTCCDEKVDGSIPQTIKDMIRWL